MQRIESRDTTTGLDADERLPGECGDVVVDLLPAHIEPRCNHRLGDSRLFLDEHHNLLLHFAGHQRAGDVARPLVTGEVQQQIVMLIKEEPGITQSMIATRLDMSRQKVNYHVTALTRQALIRVEPSGRITRLYPLHFT